MGTISLSFLESCSVLSFISPKVFSSISQSSPLKPSAQVHLILPYLFNSHFPPLSQGLASQFLKAVESLSGIKTLTNCIKSIADFTFSNSFIKSSN